MGAHTTAGAPGGHPRGCALQRLPRLTSGCSGRSVDLLAGLAAVLYHRGVDECCAVRVIPRAQRQTLQVVLGINAAMFLVESIAGILTHSTHCWPIPSTCSATPSSPGQPVRHRARRRLEGARRVAQGHHHGRLWDRHRRPGGDEDHSRSDPDRRSHGCHRYAGTRGESCVPRVALAATPRRYQHAVGVDLLAKRCDW